MTAMNAKRRICTALLVLLTLPAAQGQVAAVPIRRRCARPFGAEDAAAFVAPPRINYPQTWFHLIGGNVSAEGITEDFEAIAGRAFPGCSFSTASSAAPGRVSIRRFRRSVRGGTRWCVMRPGKLGGWVCASRCRTVRAGRPRAVRGSNRRTPCGTWHGAARICRRGKARSSCRGPCRTARRGATTATLRCWPSRRPLDDTGERLRPWPWRAGTTCPGAK